MKYEIEYIEFWATGHCNFNCKGCSSCSPLSQPWFLDLERINNDLIRLKTLDIEIHNITILGGEPLLHPKLTMIMDIVKMVYPQARLGLITNGILLSQMNDVFWKTCAKYNVKFSITCFPVMSVCAKSNIEKMLQKNNLEYRLTNKKKFNKILTQDHSHDIQDAIEACGCNRAYNLSDGKIARCTVPMVIPILNKVFNAGLIEAGTFDIYSAHNGLEILRFLNSPNDACRNCSPKPIKVEWSLADNHPKLSDWII